MVRFAALATVGGIVAAAGGGTDFAGIAALVTAVSGLVATCGALYLGARRRSADATDAALRLLLEIQAKRMNDDEEPDPEYLIGEMEPLPEATRRAIKKAAPRKLNPPRQKREDD